jgi:hypothetical protein
LGIVFRWKPGQGMNVMNIEDRVPRKPEQWNGLEGELEAALFCLSSQLSRLRGHRAIPRGGNVAYHGVIGMVDILGIGCSESRL